MFLYAWPLQWLIPICSLNSVSLPFRRQLSPENKWDWRRKGNLYSCYLPHHASSHSQFSSKGVCFGLLAEPTFPTTMLTNSNERIFLVNYVALLLLLQLTGEGEKNLCGLWYKCNVGSDWSIDLLGHHSVWEVWEHFSLKLKNLLEPDIKTGKFSVFLRYGIFHWRTSKYFSNTC